jgi:hypothetical protein
MNFSVEELPISLFIRLGKNRFQKKNLKKKLFVLHGALTDKLFPLELLVEQYLLDKEI